MMVLRQLKVIYPIIIINIIYIISDCTIIQGWALRARRETGLSPAGSTGDGGRGMEWMFRIRWERGNGVNASRSDRMEAALPTG